MLIDLNLNSLQIASKMQSVIVLFSSSVPSPDEMRAKLNIQFYSDQNLGRCINPLLLDHFSNAVKSGKITYL